jgi:transcriptional regulator with XRE-family HTH domain
MSKTRYAATENLIETLTRRERSLSWLARKIGVSPQLMWFVSKGERTLAADKAYAAALQLGEPIDYLFVSTDAIENDALVGVSAA